MQKPSVSTSFTETGLQYTHEIKQSDGSAALAGSQPESLFWINTMDAYPVMGYKTPTESPAGSLSTTPESTPQNRDFGSKLNEAYCLENQGSKELAQQIYSDFFWNADVGKDNEIENSPLKGNQLTFRFNCIKKICGEATAFFLIGKIYLVDDSNHNVRKNRQKAMECFTKAFEAGYQPAFDTLMQEAKYQCPEANYQLGAIHSNGKGGLSVNKELAFHFLKTAADLGHLTAQLDIARIYAAKHQSQSGSFAFFYKNDDLAEAIKYYEMAVKQGSTTACSELAQLYVNKGTKEDYIIAITYLRKAGNAQALVDLSNTMHDQAMVLLNGKFNFNEANAKELLVLAAELGLTKAKFEIGKIYESRIATSISPEYNRKNALKYYKEAADVSPPHVEAAVKAGKMNEAIGCDSEAKKYYDIAAKKNNIEAQARLGDKDVAFLHAQTLQQQNPEDLEVILYYEMAANWGSVDALFELGRIYELRSKDLLIANMFNYNEKKALYLYQLAANATPAHQESALRAGKIYQGRDDVKSARGFYKIAAQLGNIEASARLDDPNAAYEYARSLWPVNPDGAIVFYNNEAIVFYKIAADQGHGDAAFFLYKMYSFLNGLTHNIEEKKYLQIACQAEHIGAITIHQNIQEKATALREHQAEQQRLAKELEAEQKREKELGEMQTQLSKQGIKFITINDDSKK